MTNNASSAMYLRENVVIEPLVNSWYASSFVIPPVTAALYVANHHIKVMQSFVATPSIHVEAVKAPGMLGGPFINHPATRAGEIAELLETTRRRQVHLLELAVAVKALNDMLAMEATGTPLEPLYAKVPAILRGYVELVYDLHHRPYFRCFEALLYESSLYRTSNQTIAISVCKSDSRAFALSTPRLRGDEVLVAELPFASPIVDELSKARLSPTSTEYFVDALQIDRNALSQYFTEEPPIRRVQEILEGVRVRYLGHACILAESRQTSVLFDPLVPHKGVPGLERIGFADLPDTIDYAVITHNHQDHVLLETLLQLRHKIRHLVVPSNSPGSLADPSLKLMFRKLGFRNVIALDEMEALEFEGGSITALPFLGEHGDLDVRSKAAHLLRLGGRAILCAADSNNLEPELYNHVRNMVGRVDTVFIGMECQGAPMSWLYGPILAKPIIRKNDQGRRLDGSDCAKAVDVIQKLSPSRAYVYAMGAEPWLQFITSINYDEHSKPIVESNKFVEECRKIGVFAERLYGAQVVPV
ncbi:MBL fold metallo-hydrolase [Pendulispora brunnea]|uniref:MBL fold metallo-hydrolase n=1 Tax=Pendulispora brunnea TaxID=2905690 RepID=A0ABZ2KL49_9BACT